MYYEVYVDVLFVKNLWMNAMLLFLAVWKARETVKTGRILTAAAAGSLGACILHIASARLSGIHYFLGTFILAAGMTKIACPGRKHFFRRMFSLYAECFLLNGMLRYLEQFHRLAGVWFAVFSSISAAGLMAAEYIWNKRKRENGRTVSVVLHHGVCRISVKALYDTGNSLYDPISKKAVSILDGKVLEEILLKSERQNLPRMVPYDTIAEHGILEAYILDGMVLESQNADQWIAHPMVARMPNKSRQYQLILHRDLLSS